jgi:ADP-dependent NAD(P)H-hydrate dehydratase / NAD(P)H-hydrate epimerase
MAGVYRHELLTTSQMYDADSAAISRGISGERLMEAAGAAVVAEIRRRWASRPVLNVCGPGNNGGDGFVVARMLKAEGWPVTLALLDDRDALKGDAGLNADRWDGEVVPLSIDLLEGTALVVDALFGAGLARPLEGGALAFVSALADTDIPCVAVDVPSGVHGDTGMVLGCAVSAVLTVTFFRRKPGHLLMPGRARSGEVVVADIGIPEDVLDIINPDTHANTPALWLLHLPRPGAEDHKYTRGHAVIAGGSAMAGAGRLASWTARRVGAGLVTVAASPEILPQYTADSPGLLVLPFRTADEFADILADERKNAVLVGPGGGVSRTTHDIVLAAAMAGKALVIDADALTCFREAPGELFSALDGTQSVLTPHEGEFSRLFRMTGDKLARARKAAKLANAVILLKGADTVIAAPDGRAAINFNAPPTLATAGAGDVLAGAILGLMAQGMPPFEAAAAAAWLTGDIAAAFGPGLLAEDLYAGIPAALARLKENNPRVFRQ